MVYLWNEGVELCDILCATTVLENVITFKNVHSFQRYAVCNTTAVGKCARIRWKPLWCVESGQMGGRMEINTYKYWPVVPCLEKGKNYVVHCAYALCSGDCAVRFSQVGARPQHLLPSFNLNAAVLLCKPTSRDGLFFFKSVASATLKICTQLHRTIFLHCQRNSVPCTLQGGATF